MQRGSNAGFVGVRHLLLYQAANLRLMADAARGHPPQTTRKIVSVSPGERRRHQVGRVGALLMWDNCAVQHLASFDYALLRRLMARATVEGSVP